MKINHLIYFLICFTSVAIPVRADEYIVNSVECSADGEDDPNNKD